MLQDKNVLLISVKFFNYELLIKKELENMGATVVLYDERPSNSFFSKAIIRLKREVYKTKITSYYKKIIEEIGKKRFDYFLLIKGEAVPPFFIEFLRNVNPGIKLIYYTYDSFKNNKNGLDILNLFDSKYTFDSNDSIKYKIGFRPLFFATDYSNLYRNNKEQFIYDLAFIGTAHSDRYKIAEDAKIWCNENRLKAFTFYFSPSELLFRIKKLIEKSFKDFDKSKISFKSLSHNDIISIYNNSKVILDINHPGQKGLTMRTFESLGAGRKLITTNEDVKKYPFYNSKNIWIINRDNPVYDLSFFETEFVPIDEDLYKSMSIKGWIEEVFGLKSTAVWDNVLEN
ncbi:CgeB family protein [Sphingobacterium tabacisoli]|uniref:Lipopolysaccharide biosynthesis protein n=1 Tax=Sphingobacterium tabacisoli TaxID=2044855 RepID=A0ABW5KZ96_9SPHI|nr:hypothetical protein [Sphingobacterium tabacisoli]